MSMSTGDKVGAGLGAAAGIVQAVPVFGQIAGAFLGIGAGLAKMFGKKKKRPKPKLNTPLRSEEQQVVQQGNIVSAGGNPSQSAQPVAPNLGQPVLNIQPTPGITPVAQPLPAAGAAQPQPLPYAQKRDAWLSQALLRNRG